MASFIMNAILIVLLVIGLWLGWGLDKRLKALRAAHEGFAKAVHDLDNAAIRAHNSLKELRLDADESQDLLHGRILAARDVVQKLEAQVARAERAQREIDKGLINFEALQSLKNQPITAHPRAEPDGEDVLHFKPRTAERPQENIREEANTRENVVAAFERDRGRRGRPIANSDTEPLARPSRLPDLKPDDESEILDKVQMSELVVANLNEMIRTLTLPKRQVSSVEDDLFGGGSRNADSGPARKR